MFVIGFVSLVGLGLITFGLMFEDWLLIWWYFVGCFGLFVLVLMCFGWSLFSILAFYDCVVWFAMFGFCLEFSLMGLVWKLFVAL